MKAACIFLIVASFAAAAISRAETVSISALKAKAAQGDAKAEYQLGLAYHFGAPGILPVDLGKAAELYRQAAAQGEAEAMNNLGTLYLNGQGVPQNASTAQQWFLKAAKKGVPQAEYEVGMAYFFGDRGLSLNYNDSERWLIQAHGALDDAALRGQAANAIGVIYQKGLGTPVDMSKALSWFAKGAEDGDAKAMYQLSTLYFDGTAAKKDRAEAYKWLELAAYQDEPMAIHAISEDKAANVFTEEEQAEGEKLARDFQREHHRPWPNRPIHFTITPDIAMMHKMGPGLPPASTNAAPVAPVAPATNAASAAKGP